VALCKKVVVAESMSGRLDRREVRVGREEGKMAAVARMGATSSDAGSGSSVYPGGKVCCAVRGMALVRTGREGDETAENGGGKSEGSASCVTRGSKAACAVCEGVD
jgi:hypothetical protein